MPMPCLCSSTGARVGGADYSDAGHASWPTVVGSGQWAVAEGGGCVVLGVGGGV